MLLTLMWLGVAAGMGSVIMAAMRIQEAGVCNGYDVKIEGFKEDMLFTSEDQIVSLLKAATKGDIKGQRKSEFNLPLIEDLLEQSSWVYNADLYFDNNNILHANVTERKPLARIFAKNGASFYIDEAAKQIPLSQKITLDLPVFTGYPSKKILNASDSALIENVIATASFINSDPFWNAQVGQIDISSCGTDCWNMEMIPVVGNHKVELGDGSDIASKFHRLYLFYSQVLKRTGFDKYQKIDVQYNDQVIGVKGHYTKIDSIQLRKNIEELLQESRESNEILQVAPAVGYTAVLPADTLAQMDIVNDNNEEIPDSVLKIQAAPDNDSKAVANIAPVAVKKEPAAKIIKKPEADKKDVKKPVSTPVKDKAGQPEKNIKKTDTKKTEVKKPASGQALKKPGVKKEKDKKPEVKKEEVKRNLLVKPEAAKKPAAKTTSAKKSDSKKN